ncbi:MAG: 30S ribosomal protein S7 [Gammaproteobacteria bacterium RIFCSPHIGHO2_12_FULL_43_28]|nr:MAG: 30S ribosomal protein S7 [Gammaproteobacteria bacterium RIFCSPHIGHO2_12_FULL_43_28]
MPRRKAAMKREILPDPLYGSEDITKFINVLMRAGKKSIAEKIVYQALGMLTERLKKESGEKVADSKAAAAKSAAVKSRKPAASSKDKMQSHGNEDVMESLRRALGSIAPTVEVKSRRVGGATYQVPIEVAADRGVALAMRWAVQAAKKRSEKTMADRLAAELFEACMGRGTAVKMRDDVHRMAKANQAFAHYRW